MKKTAIALVALLLMGLVTACGGGNLAEGFEEDAVVARAKKAVEVINTRDYEAVNALLREDLQSLASADTWKDAWDQSLGEAGAFVSYKKAVAVGQKDKNTGEDYAVVVLTCTYENGTRIFTISMDADLEIVGMYMR